MIVRVHNRSQNQGRRLTAKVSPDRAWERQKEAKETKPVSFVSFFLLAAIYFLLPHLAVQAQRFPKLTLSPRFSPDPVTIDGVGGGGIPISKIAGRQQTENGPCVGFANDKPNHTLVLTARFNYLSLQVQSTEDTTMLVRGPGGTWCNDDLQGKNPGLAGQWLPGSYGIWVGSYQRGQSRPYTIRISATQ